MTGRGILTHGGFTLIEVLVSMVVVALVLTTLSVMVLLARNLDGRARSLATFVEEIDTVSALMDVLIRRGVVGGIIPPGSWPMEERGMAFLAVPPAGTGQLGLTRFELAVRSDERGRASLTVTWYDPREPVPIVEPVITAAAIHFAYRGDDPSTGVETWLERWSDTGTFPRAVRLSIRREESGDPLELVFRTAARPSDPCPVDPSLEICRSADE